MRKCSKNRYSGVVWDYTSLNDCGYLILSSVSCFSCKFILYLQHIQLTVTNGKWIIANKNLLPNNNKLFIHGPDKQVNDIMQLCDLYTQNDGYADMTFEEFIMVSHG